MDNMTKEKGHLFLHICCGPCAAYPLQFLKEQPDIQSVTGYYFNPNIHPYKEFVRRRDALQVLAKQQSLPLQINNSYPLEEFLLAALTAPDGRCQYCYEARFRETAQQAKRQGFDCFSTTLLVSPYQQHELIKETAERIAAEEEIPFYYHDFRPGWAEGVRISKELDLYRQPYCGCIISEKERYYKAARG
ncbi:MAG TPA: epoxyqueuosine reductase QueH [Patescibacteria group bacterium]|nr:epoxyqueuosine reductase QueH [Patescibacteria group bacterium]